MAVTYLPGPVYIIAKSSIRCAIHGLYNVAISTWRKTNRDQTQF